MSISGYIVIKATFALPFLVLCGILYTIFCDEYFSQHTTSVLVACFFFLAMCCFFILNGMCAIQRKPYAYIWLPEELRDCDLEIHPEIKIQPFQHSIFYRIFQFFRNVWDLCKFRPVYGILLAVGLVVLFVLLYIQMKMKDFNDDLNSACWNLILPSLCLIGLVLMMANTGMYTSAPQVEFRSYKPFQENMIMPMTVMIRRTFAAVISGGYDNFFYGMLICASVTIALNLFDKVKDDNVNYYIERLQMDNGVPHIQHFLSSLVVVIVITGFYLFGHVIMLAYAQSKRSVWAIVEKNWRRNMKAIDFLLLVLNWENIEHLEEALNVKRSQALTDKEKKAFEYIEIPLWQTKRPFVDMMQENASTSYFRSSDDMERQSFFIGKLRPAKISTRRQEFLEEPRPVEPPKDTLTQSLEECATLRENTALRERIRVGQASTPQSEPVRVTRNREYYE